MNNSEGNKLIAEFMGWELTTMNWRQDYRHFELSIKYGEECYTNNDGKFAKGNGLSFKYHTSWDWLMPVVEKIENLNYDTRICRATSRLNGIEKTECFVEIETRNSVEVVYKIGDNKINTVWLAVIEFIKWYNSQAK